MKKVILLVTIAMVISFIHVDFLTAKQFYEGKTMVLMVTTKPGGGFDTYGRLTAKFMEKHLPGSTIIVKNVPGAGHVIGVNQLYKAKPDGLTIGAFSRGLIINQIVGLPGIKFDLSKMSWIGSAASEPAAWIVSKKSSFKSLKDVIAKSKTDPEAKITMACTARGASSYIDSKIIEEVLDLKNIKIVTGYGGGEPELGMMQGEVDSHIPSWSSFKQFVEEGHGVPILFVSRKRMEGYESVPIITEFMNEKNKNLIDLALTYREISRPYAGPPNIPSDRLQILREAFKKAWADPELIKMTQKMDIPIDFIGGEEADKIVVDSLTNQNPKVVEILKDAMGL